MAGQLRAVCCVALGGSGRAGKKYLVPASGSQEDGQTAHQITASMETLVGQLLYSFSTLNEMGQQEAIRRVDELTEVPKYQRKNSLNKK
ncbi:hypothetical protein WMO64_09945 [Pseudoflavonifractor sp. CLA-AP-H29]|uniref:Uncharacterized protein n=1 Tax=Pseudoflavonifractor intestinihominis TaxID=3133171 RepID=A0ABV1EA89_9FIRM